MLMIRKFSIIPIILFLFIILFQNQIFSSDNTQNDYFKKQKAILELKKKTLDEEIERFEEMRKKWEHKKRAQYGIMNSSNLELMELSFENDLKRIINTKISETFKNFILISDQNKDKKSRLLLLSIVIDSKGQVTNVQIQKSEVTDNTEEKIMEKAKGMKFLELKDKFSEYVYRFPLLIKE